MRKNINNKIVIVGRLEKYKKFILGTIEILKNLSNKNLKIDVIGDGSYRKNFRTKMQKSFFGR